MPVARPICVWCRYPDRIPPAIPIPLQAGFFSDTILEVHFGHGVAMKELLRTGLFFCAVLGSVWAQTVGAGLQGTVSDPSGAVIAGASVQITNVGTGAVRTLSTDAS